MYNVSSTKGAKIKMWYVRTTDENGLQVAALMTWDEYETFRGRFFNGLEPSQAFYATFAPEE